MCYHKRLLYTKCHHVAWGPEVRPCDTQRALQDGYAISPCELMFAHPLHSICIQGACAGCDLKKKKMDGKVQRAKEKISKLRETVGRLQGEHEERGRLGEKRVQETCVEKEGNNDVADIDADGGLNERWETLSVIVEEDE